MKKVLLPAAVLMLVLAGCAAKSDKAPATKAASQQQTQTQAQQAQPQVRVDTRKEVAYLCDPKGQNKLNVMYGMQGNDVVAAQIKYQNSISPVLFRNAAVTDNNTFTSESGIIWSAAKSTGATIDKVNGLRLLQPAKKAVNGKVTIVNQVVTQNCKLDRKATAALAKAAAAETKKTTK